MSHKYASLSQMSFNGIDLPVGSQDLETLLQINSQDLLNVNFYSQNDNIAIQSDNSRSVPDAIESESEGEMMHSDEDEELVAAMDEILNGPDESGNSKMHSDEDEELVAAMDEILNGPDESGNSKMHSDEDEELVAAMDEILNGPDESGNSKEYQCQVCDKKYKHKRSLERHILSTHQRQRYMCSKCSKSFSQIGHKKRHENKCQGKQDHPQKRKTEEPEASSSKKQRTPPPSKTLYKCRQCKEGFNNRRELYVHRMRTHFQVGQGIQPRPWGNRPAPWEFDGGEVDENFRDVYQTNEPLILEQHQRGPIESRYNFPVQNDVSVDEMMHFVSDIYEEQQYAFRLNLVFGVILQNRETGEYRYFAPYSNFEVLEDPVFISRRLDLRKLQRILHRKDIMTTILANRPDTKWIPVLLCNIIFRVTTTNYTVGGGQTLPDYIRDKRSIYSLVVDVNTRKLYEDNLCAFRCLALHKGNAINVIEKPAQEMFKQWCNFKKSNKKFNGVAYEEFPDFESFFKAAPKGLHQQDQIHPSWKIL
ncbi:hypothetical protein KUTeg_009489 [Tegillarca granosa]|uniref:C2H2-type domain-containing protein n=1 Tax=Tegillarca granosa TaxID=220873 RepID=A0ABQ9F7C6_TEGGR|nr:hypothetical protein KUTeg_009489 [Tegillarca granosa]